MKRVSTGVCLPVFVLCFIGVAGVRAAETASPRDWPEGYVAKQSTISPDKRFGVIVPSHEMAEQEFEENYENFLADLKTRQVLGKIEGADYFDRQNHRGLDATWAPDSSACVLIYGGRFGYDHIQLLEIEGARFAQTDLGEHIAKVIKASVGEDGTGSAWFRFSSGGKLQVRALDYTGNPKMMDEKTKQTRFAGTFDRATKKWVKAEARRTKDYDVLSDAYAIHHGENILVIPNRDQSKVPSEFTGAVVDSEEDKEKYLDERMNTVYRAVRALLPAAQFAKVKEEQKAWLKKRDATPASERSALIVERTKALEEFLWK